MINSNGPFYKETLASLTKSLKLDSVASIATTENAKNIINKIVQAYQKNVGKDHVGSSGKGVPANFRKSTACPVGLVYGRIQSGKTRAMITSTAMAFDNGFRIAIVMTSNINDLVSQTHLDFSRDLAAVRTFTKDDELKAYIDIAKLDLNSPKGRILIITSKGGKSLKNVIDFLNSIGSQNHPILIFDDEGDQASLDTNTYKRSKSGDLTLEKSTINKLIGKLRTEFPACVYVSVTGTPQAVLLQTASSDNRPSFIEMLPAGAAYIGGDTFFSTAEPEDNSGRLISIVPDEDKSTLLSARSSFPEGLRDSILFFLLAASAAKHNLDLPDNGKGYQFLCHPSLKNNEQAQARDRILKYLYEIQKVLGGNQDTLNIIPALKTQYRKLRTQLGLSETPGLGVLEAIIDTELKRAKILVINAENSKRKGIEYGPGFNFLIGGNTLGRGIAIPNLLVTYYVRQAVTSQMDTMYQHARMFGYRSKTLPYTQLFTTIRLYFRFRDIYTSDESLREFIENHASNDPTTFPIDTSIGLKPTRKGVLDLNSVRAVGPGMQIYPNKMKLPQTHKSVNKVWSELFRLFKIKNKDKVQLQKVGEKGILISINDAIDIVSQIKTSSQNSWHDNSIQDVMSKLSKHLGTKVLLKFRTADRTILEDGIIATGTLSGDEQRIGRAEQNITLWIMEVTPKKKHGRKDLEPFIYPTIVVPSRLPRIFVFSK